MSDIFTPSALRSVYPWPTNRRRNYRRPTLRKAAAPKSPRRARFAKEARHSRRAPKFREYRAGRRLQLTVIRAMGVYPNRHSAYYFDPKWDGELQRVAFDALVDGT
jgi:hypothetical protein